MKRHVLVVDDEKKIVEGLSRAFRRYRDRWEITTATSAAQALEVLSQDNAHKSFDAIVSDMRMPGMDGAALLGIVREKYPAMMRVVLSGQTEHAAALRVVPVAHQFLDKPTDPGALIDLLTRLVDAKDAVVDGELRRGVGMLESLPSSVSTCAAIIEIAASSDSSGKALDGIAALVGKDPALAAKALQLSCSSFFGARRKVADVGDAVSSIGVELLHALQSSSSILTPRKIETPLFERHSYRQRARLTSEIGRTIAEILAPGNADVRATASSVGLLHSIGELILAVVAPAMFHSIASAAAENGRSFDDEQRRAPGFCGVAKLGAYLLELWGLPPEVVNAVSQQLDHASAWSNDAIRVADATEGPPRRPPHQIVSDALFIAKRIVDDESFGCNDVDSYHLERLGLWTALPAIRARLRTLRGAMVTPATSEAA